MHEKPHLIYATTLLVIAMTGIGVLFWHNYHQIALNKQIESERSSEESARILSAQKANAQKLQQEQDVRVAAQVKAITN